MKYLLTLFTSFCAITGTLIADAEKEAQEHFDRAGGALLQALGHSAAAGATIEIPPLAIFEGYQAVEAWKEAAKEYNAGCEARDRAEDNNMINRTGD